MAGEISLVCNFIFGSIRTSLLMDKVDVNLTIRMVKGIYMYCKDHTMESTIFTLWSKSVIPFPSLTQTIQAFRNDKNKIGLCHGVMAVHSNFPPLPRPPEAQENVPLANKDQMVQQKSQV